MGDGGGGVRKREIVFHSIQNSSQSLYTCIHEHTLLFSHTYVKTREEFSLTLLQLCNTLNCLKHTGQNDIKEGTKMGGMATLKSLLLQYYE